MQVTEAQRQLATAEEVPLLRLTATLSLPNGLFGLLFGGCVGGMVLLPNLFAEHPIGELEALGPALFFGVTFLIWGSFTTPVYRAAADDLRSLQPVLPLSTADVECLARGLTRATALQIRLAVTAGILAGVAHAYLLALHELSIGFAITQSLATIGLWVVLVTTFVKMMMNAALFSQLGKSANPDLLRPSQQAPFGAAATRPAMFIIGILCAYPLLSTGGDGLSSGVWLGFSTGLATLIGIIVMPLGGIRRRIQLRRREVLVALDRRLEAMALEDVASVSADSLRDMDTVLDMRERVASAPSWPLDLAGLQRILLYLVIPPLTWVAAALVERLVDTAVG